MRSLLLAMLFLALAAGASAQPLALVNADSLLRAGRFEEAAAGYRSLLERDSTQIAPLMGLGRATSRVGRIEEAIGWYRRALVAGAAPQNLIAYLIAQLHARRGDRDSTIAWLKHSLAFRLERRSVIAGDSLFARWRDDPEFRELAGRARREITDRTEGWRADIDHLVTEARRMHAGPERPAFQPGFAAAADELKRRVPSLSDGRLAAEVQRLLAMLGDGHSILYPASSARVTFTRVPIDLWFFSDGLAVVGADTALAGRVGQRIVAVGGAPIADVMRRLDPYITRDNPMGPLVLGSFFMTMPPFLEAVGLSDGRTIDYTFALPTGGQETVSLAPAGLRAPAFKLMPAPGMSGERPRYLRHPEANLWLEPLPDLEAVYVQYNQVANGPTIPVGQFADSLSRTLRRSGAGDLIVDVRRNNGGNNELNRPLIRAMIDFEMEPGRRIWVITSRTTFSAAQNFINLVERWTSATFVGEPSGSKPNFAGEDTELILPYSGLRGSISTRWWQDSGPLDRRQWIAPHLSVPVQSADHFGGRDPVLDAIISAIRARRG
ncbi:MAG: hypothetical protein ACKVZ0_23660 [Gemmatimonadales bacterium]